MKLDEYQATAVSLAIYPASCKLAYPTLGLCGELGEMVEAWNEECDLDDTVVKEIGDVMWYAANVASDADLKLSDICGRKTFPRPEMSCWCTDGLLLDMTIMAGIVAENTKKSIRDNNGVLTDERRENIKKALRKMIFMLAEFAYEDEISLHMCARLNLNKLESRKERGTLRGDGNNR